MISVEEKINIFQNELQSQVDELKIKEIKKANEEAAEREARAAREIEEEDLAIKERYKKLEARNYEKILADGNRQARNLILSTKNDIRKNFIKVIQKDCENYLNSETYKKYLKNSLIDAKKNLKDSKSIILFIKESDEIDRKFFDDNLKDFVIEYKELPDEDLGGFIIQDVEGRVNYDYTLYSLIDDNIEQIDHHLEKVVNGESN